MEALDRKFFFLSSGEWNFVIAEGGGRGKGRGKGAGGSRSIDAIDFDATILSVVERVCLRVCLCVLFFAHLKILNLLFVYK